MTITVKRDGRLMCTYRHPVPEEWKKQMKKAGYKVKEVKDDEINNKRARAEA